MRVACVMMQKNEMDLLELWICYHAGLFGLTNLHVVDNGSDIPEVIEILRYYRTIGLNVDFSKSTDNDFIAKGEILGNIMRKIDIEQAADIVVPLDCDEFFAVQTNNGITVDKNDILLELGLYKNNPHVLRVNHCLVNVPGAFGQFCRWDYKKVLFAQNTFQYMDRGFHGGVSKLGDGYADTSVVYIHLHFKKFQVLVAHSEEKLKKYTDISNRGNLDGYQGNGWHLVKYLLMSEQDYLSRFDNEIKIGLPQFVARIAELALSPPEM